MNIVFFGNERLASACTTKLPILHSLLESGHNIQLIVISEKGTKSRSKRALEVEEFATKHRIELFIPASPEDLKKKLEKLNLEVGVLAAYGRIISQELIDLFPKGIINLHPSLLPKYRGPTPIESAILNGDEETGVSIMALNSGMDSGPLYSQTELKLSGKESKQELADNLGLLGAREIIKVLEANNTPKDQEGPPTFCALIKKEDGKIDLQESAETIERKVRAYLGWPSSTLSLQLNDGSLLVINVTQAEVLKESDESPLTFKTSKDFLKINTLKLPGKNEMSAKDFLNGYKDKLAV